MKINDIITEGGNVFAGKTGRIKLENIMPTLTAYFAELKSLFPKKANIFNVSHFDLSPEQQATTKHFVPLGSVGKSPDSGDIDLGIDASYILDKKMSAKSIAEWGIDPMAVDATSKLIQSRARTATPEQCRLRAFLKLLVEHINANAPNLHCDEKKVTAGNIFGLYPQIDTNGKNLGIGVQIDWMIGNLGWLTFSYYSSKYPAETNVKGLHRTQLLLSMFQAAELQFDHVHGVKDKATGERISTEPVGALKILSDRLNITPPLSQSVASDYFQLQKVIHTLPPAVINRIYDTYLKILDSTRCDIPADLQPYWVQNKKRLGLQGKFLPPTSALSQYLGESGVTGADRVGSRADFSQFLKSYQQVISKFPGFTSMTPSGSYNSNPNKQDFGDIDLVVHIKSAKTKQDVKKEMVAFFTQMPDTVIVPFSSPKHTGKRSYNSGEIVTVRYHEPTLGYSAQIDNIVALDHVEARFKGSFLDMPAEVQGLVLGLVKVATIERPVADIFKSLGISASTTLPENQEYAFNLSSAELQLRKVTYKPGTFEQAASEVVWRTTNYSFVKKLLAGYNLDTGFDDLLAQVVRNIRNPRSGRRIVGVFKSMISVKSGEVGTPKGQEKERAIAKVSQELEQ